MAKIPHVPPTPSSAPSTPSSGVAAPNAAKPLPIDVELVKAAQASGDEELARAVQLFVEDWKNRGPEKTMGPKQAFTEYVKKVGNDSSPILAQKLGQFMGVNTKMFEQLGGVGPVNAGDAAAPSRPSPPAAAQAAPAAAANPAASKPAPAAKGKGGDSLPGGMKFSEAAAVIFRDGVGKLPPEVAADIASNPKKLKSVQKELSGLHFNPKAMNPLVAQDGKLSGGDKRPATVQDYAPASPDKAKAAQSDLIYQVLTHRLRAEKRAQGVPFPEEPELDPEVVAEFERLWSGLKGDTPKHKTDHAVAKTDAAAAKLVAAGSPSAGLTTQPTPPTNVQSNLNAAVGNQNIVNGPAVSDPAPTPAPKDPAPAADEPPPSGSPSAAPQPDVAQRIVDEWFGGLERNDEYTAITLEEAAQEYAAWKRIHEASGNGVPDDDTAVREVLNRIAERQMERQIAEGEADARDVLAQAAPAAKSNTPPSTANTPAAKPPSPAQAAAKPAATPAAAEPKPAEKDSPPPQEAAKPQTEATPEANPKDSTPPSTKDSPSTWVSWMKRHPWMTATGAGAAGLGAAYLLNKQYPDNRSQQLDPRMPQPGPAGGPGTDSLPPLWSDQLQDESLDDYLHRRARSSGMSGNAPGLPFHVGATAGRYGS